VPSKFPVTKKIQVMDLDLEFSININWTVIIYCVQYCNWIHFF